MITRLNAMVLLETDELGEKQLLTTYLLMSTEHDGSYESNYVAKLENTMVTDFLFCVAAGVVGAEETATGDGAVR